MSVSTVQAIINGTTYILTYNSSTGKYEKTITAPSKSSYTKDGHYYPVTLKATDDAGNTTTVDAADSSLGSQLQLKVVEKVAPVVEITYPTASALISNNKPTFAWTVTDDDSGVNPDTIGITIDSGSKITGSSIGKTAITGGYSCTYTPSTALSDGSHTIKVNASDYDGNAASQKSVTFNVDVTPPTLSVTAPTEGMTTNQSSVTVKGTTNDATSSPVTVTIKLNSGAETTVTVASDGSFSHVLTLASGTNTIVVKSTDGAGQTTTITRTVVLDTGAPVFKSISISPNPADAGETITISVVVED